MLLGRDERLEDRIVRAVACNPAPKAEDIHKAISGTGRVWSLAATYKALKKLTDSGVLLHSKGRYYISQGWIFSLSGLIDQYFETALGQGGEEHLLPPVGGSYSWRYTDLLRLNSFATNVILMAIRKEATSHIFSWSPHLWFNLVQSEHERRYHQALRELGVRVHKVVGGDGSLDVATAGQLPKSMVKTRFVPDRKFLPRNNYTIVAGSFVITMKLQNKTMEAIDSLFARAQSIETIDVKLLLQIFRYNKAPSTLTVEHDAEKASDIAEKFARVAGNT